MKRRVAYTASTHAQRLAVAQAIRARREELGLSRAELAARAGLSVASVAHLEQGTAHYGPGPKLQQVAVALELPAAVFVDLAFGTDVPPEDRTA